jgi:hypothetical protein
VRRADHELRVRVMTCTRSDRADGGADKYAKSRAEAVAAPSKTAVGIPIPQNRRCARISGGRRHQQL